MNVLFGALVWGHIRANRLRSFVTVVAVALGVAIALAVDLANATAVASFSQSVNVISNHVNLQVVGVGRGFDERAILRVERVPGVLYASPTIEESLAIDVRPGDPFSGEILRVLGVDLLRPFGSAVSTPSGSANTASDAANTVPGTGGTASPGLDPSVLIDGRGALVSERVARAHHWQVGTRFAALAGDRIVRLRVAGIIPAGSAAFDSSVLFVDIVTAQELFGKVGFLDRIDCIVDPARVDAVRAAVAAVIPPGTRAIQPSVRTDEIRRMLRSFQLNLAALSYIALLVGMYLIYNTVAISVVQRRFEIGTLRAIGARRSQIFRTFIAEGALFGTLGSALGLGFGALLAQLSVGAVSRTVDTLYVASHADSVVYDPLVLAKAFVLGVVAATIAALVPALDAAATPPAIAMRASGYERRSTTLARRCALVGVLAFGVGGLCTLAPAIDDMPLFGYAAGLWFIFAGSLCAPLSVELLSRLGIHVLRARSASGELAAANLGATPIRTSVAVASLMIAIAMTVAVAILIGSFRTTVVAWANETLRADLFVKPQGLADASFDARFSPEVVTRLRALSGVEAADTFRGISLPLRGRVTTLGATDVASFARRNELELLGGVSSAQIARTLPGTTGVLVSEPFASKFGVRVGDAFSIDTAVGPTTLRVAAIYNDYSSDAGMAIIDRATFKRLYHDDSVNSIAIYAKPGTDLARLRSDVQRAVLPLRIDVETTRELRAIVLQIFDRTFAITYALYVISITIAVLGVVSTLFALVLERRREIGLLRYLGLRVAQVRTMVLVEAGLIGVLGGVSGVVLGVILALLLIFVINRQAFGWLIDLHVPYDFLGEAIVLVIVAAVLAGIYPARVAARIRTAEAVRSE